jgi:hypothetical protein
VIEVSWPTSPALSIVERRSRFAEEAVQTTDPSALMVWIVLPAGHARDRAWTCVALICEPDRPGSEQPDVTALMATFPSRFRAGRRSVPE